MATKRKRGTRGPVPGTGGRPPIVGDEAATSLTVRLHGQHRAMLARLRRLWALGSDTETLRRALELAAESAGLDVNPRERKHQKERPPEEA